MRIHSHRTIEKITDQNVNVTYVQIDFFIATLFYCHESNVQIMVREASINVKRRK